MFQDYDTSAKLVKATQRNGAPDMSVRSPRTDRIFISKSEDSPPNRNHNFPSSNSDAPPDQLGLLSKSFAAALLGVAAPAPGPSDLHGSGVPPVVVDGERVVVNGVAQEPDGAAAAVASQDLLSSARGRPAGRAHTRDDSATCRAVLAKYAAEKEAAARRRGDTQAEGEKTSELEE
jgi:hypothetical protein